MGKTHNTNDLFDELKKIIDLPDGVISLDLKLRINEIPTIETVEYATHSKSPLIGTVTKRYKLEEIK